MTRKTQLVHLLLFLAALVGIDRALTGSFRPPTGDSAIWFHAGLLMLIIGVYWVEPYFTKPADVVVNGLVVFIAISTLTDAPLLQWWTALRLIAVGCVIVAFLIVWAGSPAIAGNDNSRLKRLAYLATTRIGNSAVLYSAVFILSLLSYFDLHQPAPKWLVAFWGIVVTARYLDIAGFLSGIARALGTVSRDPVGRLTRFVEPGVARFEVLSRAQCSRGTLVAFTSNGTIDHESPLALVVTHRSSPNRVEAEAVLIDSHFAEGALDSRQIVVKADRSDPVVRTRLERTTVGGAIQDVAGFASRDSNIARLRIELMHGAEVGEGDLAAVAPEGKKPILFQITNGTLCEESAIDSGERIFVVADAQQLGTWDVERQGFAAHSWVVSENAPVLLHPKFVPEQRAVRPGLLEVGAVPSSDFPVDVNLSSLVLFHTAVLGVTGSGKSFLAFQLIEACAASGIKVLCLDLTGDYQRYLRGAVRVASTGAVTAFLDNDQHMIGVIEFTDRGQIHPITATNAIAKTALEWCRRHRQEEEVREPRAKVLLVLEEAHSLVPEWNSNPVQNLQMTVNLTSQVALQARKYGLGFMVITQRTANVTKSILNQCNTIFAFQAYDETGFDFMKNYMGVHYVQALPTLKKRHGVLVGKASTSDQPIIVRFHDQQRDPLNVEAPTFEVPAAAAAAQ